MTAPILSYRPSNITNESVDPVALAFDSGGNPLRVSLLTPLPVTISGGERELVVVTYLVKNAFTGASVGDTVTQTQIIDVTPGVTPSVIGVIWYNQSAAAPLGSVPSASNLALTGTSAVTDAQMAARAYALDGADATGIAQLAGGVGIRGWLSGIFSKLSGVIAVSGSAAAGSAPTHPPLSVSGVDGAGNKQHLKTDTGGNLGTYTASIRATSTVSIANGASVSGSVDLTTTSLLGFVAPAAWTAAALNIEVSTDNATWVTTGLFDGYGLSASTWSSVTAGAGYSVDASTMLPWRYVRFRSGTAASPVNQGAQRDFTVITRPLA